MRARVIRLAVLVVALAVGAAACGKYSISNIRSLKAFQDANALYKKGEYSRAAQRYTDAVTLNPDLGFAYFFLGNSYDNLYKPGRRGEPENDANLPKAAENYRLAVEKLSNSTDPKEQEIRKLSFEYLIAVYGPEKLNDFTKAEPVAKELIAIAPNEPTGYQTLGRMYEDVGRYDEAEQMLQKAISLRPNEALGYMLLAGYYNRQGEFEKTIDAWKARAKAEPNNPEAWHTIGVYYFDKLHRDTNFVKTQRDKAMAYTLDGIEAENKALSLNGEYFEALTYKNILLRQQALLEKDPAKQKQLIQDADVLKAKAEELQKKQNATAAGQSPQRGRGR
ncbi:MAG: tetratricopeptide repeat protein [Acidobacteriota bacterium]